MSFLDKLMFWKKEPGVTSFGEPGHFGSGEPFKTDIGMPKEEPFEEESLSTGITPPYPAHPKAASWQDAPQPARFGGPSLAPQQQFAQQNREMELVSAKLDAIKANLESINQRLANLERIAKESI